MDFIDELPVPPQTRTNWIEVGRELKNNPGKWAAIKSYKLGTSMAGAVRGSLLLKCGPGFEAVQRKTGDELVVYARWVRP